MKPHRHDPRRLDVVAFARSEARLQGEIPLASFERLAQATVAAADGEVATVQWSAQGRWHQPVVGPAQPRLQLEAIATVRLSCQRCLQPFAQELVIDRGFLFVPGEEEAARLDEDSEEDVLAVPRSLDLESLIEDELILALPIVPRHGRCPEPLVATDSVQARAEADGLAPAHPFAALAGFKPGR
jgi:uncharacterized protein